MKKFYSLLAVLAFLLSACASQTADGIPITIYRSPTCGCCGAWADYVADNGFKPTEENTRDMSLVKVKYHVPIELQSCHTAIIDGYVIEGHVPVREIKRLLQERPAALGIAVGGMPIGSPGMEVADVEAEPFNVILFYADGTQEIYANYP